MENSLYPKSSYRKIKGLWGSLYLYLLERACPTKITL
jgi:hypothetical protein